MGVILGQSKNLGQDSAMRPADMVYGKKNPNKGIGALEVIRGRYSEAETAPDKDLGKSIMPGFRNISFEVILNSVPWHGQKFLMVSPRIRIEHMAVRAFGMIFQL
jgi:hypothetical protein